jgi:photosystem II stability/assembly factor-like uncharacterized protein
MKVFPTALARAALVISLVAEACLLVPPSARAQAGGPPELKGLQFRSIGPSAGGRVCRAAGVPGDPLTYYAAAAAGGVWKSGDGGLTWKPIFDGQPVASVGSLALAPSDPNVVYVGSGEANIRGNVEAGEGIWKSVDAGKTWRQVWKQEGQIGTMIVHPTNPDVAFAAVLGHGWGPNPERGVYRTTDGGKTWRQVLGKDDNTGASDVSFDPSNPNVLFAGLWQARRRPWELSSGGPGSGLYTSHDGGDTWTQLVPPPDPHVSDPGEAAKGQRYCKGLPAGVWGKVGVAVAPSDNRRVYALIEADEGGLYRSDDGGDTWQRVNGDRALCQRAWYYSTLTVDPSNPDGVWCPQVSLLHSIDGGKTFNPVTGTHHGDHHDLWIDPKNPRRMIDSNDGGVDASANGGEDWYAPHLPLAQFYHVRADNRTPYWVCGTMQDLGTASGPSNSLSAAGISPADWRPVGGGESGFVVPDPSDPNIVYAGEYGGYLSRYDERTRQARCVSVYPFNATGHTAAEVKYRFQWTSPVLVSPHDAKVIYHAANVLFHSGDAGEHWTPISPDLTRDDKTKEQWSGGPVTGDNTGVEYYCTIFAVAESPCARGVLWAGSDDGLVHVSRDGGKQWDNVTKNIPGMPEWGTVDCIEASPHDAGTAYLVVDAHRLDDRRPYLWKTADYGKTWESLAGGLPGNVSLRVVREDPKRKGLLYVGTEHGIAFSTDDGRHWRPLRLNLPTVPVNDLVVKDDDLVVGTNGRSIWIFDDLTPVRALAGEDFGKAVALLPVPPAIRYSSTDYEVKGHHTGYGDNPPDGAILHYYLPRKPQGPVTLRILDADGRTVQSFSSTEGEGDDDGEDTMREVEEQEVFRGADRPRLPTTPGLHRVAWDLCYAGARDIEGAAVESGNPRGGPPATPGRYTVRLTADGRTVTQPLVIRLDPRQRIGSPATAVVGKDVPVRDLPRSWVKVAYLKEGELQEQLRFALQLRDDISRLADMVNQLRAVREQLRARDRLLAGDPGAKDLIRASRSLAEKLTALEERVHNPRAKVPYDILAQRGGAKVYSQLVWLFELCKDSDGAPTPGVRQVYADQVRILQDVAAEYRGLIASDLARLNEEARKRDVPTVRLPRGPAAGKATEAAGGRKP